MSFIPYLKKHLIQAPLAGYTCAPFRVQAHQWGSPDYCYSEMLSAQHIASNAPNRTRYSYKSPKEGLWCVQLASDLPDELKRAAETVITWGADMIDLNIGCPQPKIRKKNLGSKLLAHSERVYQLIKILKDTVSVPVLAKIRVDHNSQDTYNHDIAHAIEAAGADALTVHGRHWTEDYDVEVSYQDIAEIKQLVKIPVIGNGDVKDALSATKMFTQTQCDAVMIGRASVGQPWIFEQIHQELKGNSYIPPNLQEIGEIFLTHIQELIALENEHIALLQSRKLGKYYARSHITAPDFFEKIQQVSDYTTLTNLVRQYFVYKSE